MNQKRTMDSAKEIRSDILEIVFNIEDVNMLASIRQQLQVVYNAKKESIPPFMQAVKPIRKNVSLETLMAEQHYKPVDYKQFREKVSDIEWEESLNELLDALTK